MTCHEKEIHGRCRIVSAPKRARRRLGLAKKDHKQVLNEMESYMDNICRSRRANVGIMVWLIVCMVLMGLAGRGKKKKFFSPSQRQWFGAGLCAGASVANDGLWRFVPSDVCGHCVATVWLLQLF